ncbi:MAG: GNAT family N-acetyltransferase [Bacteroidota bacterium]
MSKQIQIFVIKTEADWSAARNILWEYAENRGFDAALDGFEMELAQLPIRYGPPKGCFLLAQQGHEIHGCVAFRSLSDSVCEMKRMYVRPVARGQGIGRSLLIELLQQAAEAGYGIMRLDTHPSMLTAQALYQSLGFREIGRYNQNPIPGIRFFEKKL